MEYLTLGKIIDTFSLDGSVKILSSTTNQDIRYKKGNHVLIDINGEMKEYTIDSYRKSSSCDIVRFVEINNVDDAVSLKGKEVLVVKDSKDLKEGYYFYSDLAGCDIIVEDKSIGKVLSVEEFPAQLTLRCKSLDGKTFFIPFVKAFIKNVDIKKKEIEINFVEGLL